MDLYHVFGNDLTWSAGGDVQTVDGSLEGQQRVIRRVLTVPPGYIWEPTYGCGVPQLVGGLDEPARIEATVLLQMLQEQAVAQVPPPAVSVTPLFDGQNIRISYQDANTGDPVLLVVRNTP
jgi:hypothetical protein